MPVFNFLQTIIDTVQTGVSIANSIFNFSIFGFSVGQFFLLGGAIFLGIAVTKWLVKV